MTLEEVKKLAIKHGEIVCSPTDDMVHVSCKDINEYIVDAFIRGAASRQPEINDMLGSLKSISSELEEAQKLLNEIIG